MGFSLSYKPLYHAKHNAQRNAYVPKFLCPYEFISKAIIVGFSALLALVAVLSSIPPPIARGAAFGDWLGGGAL